MHVISTKIQKEVFTKEGDYGKMYILNMSEANKDKNGEWEYTNYSATFFAKTDGARTFYDEVLQPGNVVTVSCDKLRVRQKDGYVTMEMVFPKLDFWVVNVPF